MRNELTGGKKIQSVIGTRAAGMWRKCERWKEDRDGWKTERQATYVVDALSCLQEFH